MTPNEILIEATTRKIKLRPDGTRLIATNVGPVPPDIERLLIENKVALLKLLEGKRHLARQVLQGEFEPLDEKTFSNVCSELVMQHHDQICGRAFEFLRRKFQQTPNQK
jgi:hypothetical protein